MAAFCACCGTEITLKAEACPVCGTPRHGMLQQDQAPTLEFAGSQSEEDAEIGRKFGEKLACRRQ